MAYEWHFSKTAIEKYFDIILELNIDDYYCYRWFFQVTQGLNFGLALVIILFVKMIAGSRLAQNLQYSSS